MHQQLVYLKYMYNVEKLHLFLHYSLAKIKNTSASFSVATTAD